MKKITVLGAGSWGTAQALLLAKKTRHIALWGRVEDGIDIMCSERENKRFLPGVRLDNNIVPTTDLKAAVDNTELIVLAVPTQAVREVLKLLAPYLKPGTIIVNTAKGLEIVTTMRLSQVAADVLGTKIREQYAVLSGPSHAEEVAQGLPTVVTAASYSRDTAIFVQDAFMSPVFRVYTNPDVAGVELGGALKNIIALATGMCDGLGFGDNTRAALMTRGLTEITRMGVALGGDYRTFSGLSGMGDLMVTCGSKYSRNRRAGELLGRGYNLQQALEEIGMAVEGVHTVRVVNQIANQVGVDMPISKACYKILYENKLALETVETLMKRRKKHELEEIAVNIKGW